MWRAAPRLARGLLRERKGRATLLPTSCRSRLWVLRASLGMGLMSHSHNTPFPFPRFAKQGLAEAPEVREARAAQNAHLARAT